MSVLNTSFDEMTVERWKSHNEMPGISALHPLLQRGDRVDLIMDH